jgi:hypothetical protein
VEYQKGKETAMEAPKKEHRIQLRDALRDAQRLVEKLAPVRAGTVAPEVAVGKLRDVRTLVSNLARYPFRDIAAGFADAPELPKPEPAPPVTVTSPKPAAKPVAPVPEKTEQKGDQTPERKAEPKPGQRPRVR